MKLILQHHYNDYKEIICSDFSEAGHAVAVFTHYLQEISFLYEQISFLRTDEELSWKDIHDFERRREAHLNGLVEGGELALAFSLKRCEEGDFGEFFGAVSLFCRRDSYEFFKNALILADDSDEEYQTALFHALSIELPESWIHRIIELIKDEEFHLWKYSLIRSLAYRRVKTINYILKDLINTENNENHLATLIWSLGRIGMSAEADNVISTCSDSENGNLIETAAGTLLRFGRFTEAEEFIQKQPLTPLRVNAKLHITSETPLLLGLEGEVSSLEPLLQILSSDNSDNFKNGEAALALFIITGAELYEEHFIPEEIHEDELFEEELEKIARGETIHEPNEVPGSTIRRITRDPKRWKNWISDKKDSFSGSKLRLGKAYNIQSVIDSLKSDKLPHYVRNFITDELAINFNVESPFETDMRVVDQIKYLNRI